MLLGMSLVAVGCFKNDESAEMKRINDEINLIIACTNGSLSEAELYSNRLGTVNFVSIKGDTPLNAAVANGNFEVVKFLIKQGAKPSLKDSYGLSAMETARKYKQYDIEKYISNIKE
ncbi:ankyrin repeat domain-containing protein [Microbulbifer sp. THAF38]|uniref:ankyrin repeat domain-containing protein n=1 Tax=Microbulbifer sp. THAF38 TaxID=2587856 RepID=UPI0020A4FA1C|nr:ankyrin repeat domain-containing protein [Microbulbifer sp. THAF38]